MAPTAMPSSRPAVSWPPSPRLYAAGGRAPTGLPHELYAAFKLHLVPMFIATFQKALGDIADVASLTATQRFGLMVVRLQR